MRDISRSGDSKSEITSNVNAESAEREERDAGEYEKTSEVYSGQEGTLDFQLSNL